MPLHRSNRRPRRRVPRRFCAVSICIAAAALASCDSSETASTTMAGGGSSSSSMGGAGGAGATGGMVSGCEMPEVCPGIDTECKARSCDDGICGFFFVPSGNAANEQTPDDCQARVCDGYGVVFVIHDNQDILVDGNPCTADACNAGSPLHEKLPEGTACTGNGAEKACNAAGQCVECLGASDCESGVCQLEQCVPATCIDTVKNGNETDDDCGGNECAPCADGKVCTENDHCVSQVCTEGICAEATCSDQKKNGDETDVDCGGGACEKCETGQGCALPVDCIGGICSGTICLPSCIDTVKNADETDVDCGGPTCAPCGPDKNCSVESDCASGVCTNGVCGAPTCLDGVTNGDETGMDCGGPDCQPCGDGQPCNLPLDCESGVCDATCQAPTCGDSAKNGDETDIDCGGSVCWPCGAGEACILDADCLSDSCSAGTCADSSCGDGAINGTDVCDDGDQTSGDGCDALCTVEAGYECTGSPSVCATVCGDGLKLGAEACDDGNVTDDDGCSALCGVEPGYTCPGTPSVCAAVCGDGLKLPAEQCEDGNAAGGDCCAANCTIEAGCEIEPNDTTALASALAPMLTLSQSGAMKGRIQPTSEVDVFSIQVTSLIDLRIETFEGLAPGACLTADTFLELLDSTGAVIASDNDDGLLKCSLIDPVVNDFQARGLAPGEYYLRVSESGNDAIVSAYNVVWTATAICNNGVKEGSEQCDDANAQNGDGCSAACKLEPTPEVEGNNTCATANGPYTALPPLGRLVSGTLTAGDQDWFAFSLPATADVVFDTFDASGPGSCASTDTQIEVFGPDCMTALGSAKNGGGIGACAKLDPAVDSQVRHLPAGTYKVRVSEPSSAPIPGYTLHALVTALCGNSIEEGFETCDVGPGGGSNCTTTCDRIAACGDGFKDLGESCDDGNLVGGDGCSATCATVESGYACGSFGGPCIPICGNGAMTGGEGCDDGDIVGGDGCDSACEQEGAPSAESGANGTFAEADAGPLINSSSVTISGAIEANGDKDIFKVALAAPSVIRLETFDGGGTSCAGGITTTLRLFNATMMQIGTDNASGIASCSAYVAYLPAGNYYVQVEETGNNAQIAAYKLQIKVEEDSGSETESNENQLHADPLVGADVFILGNHQVNTDSDYYAVTIPAAGRALRAEIIEGGLETCESNGIDSRLTLYDFGGTQKVDDDDDGRGFCSLIDGTGGILSLDAGAKNLVAGTYFLQVRASPGAGPQNGPSGQFDYRLVVTIR